jgi:hypothetical protein
MSIMEEQEVMPPLYCAYLELRFSSSYANGATVLMNAISDQTSLAWPDEFPRKIERNDPVQQRAAFELLERVVLAGRTHRL